MPPRVETVASFAKGLEVIRSFGPDARRQTITDVSLRTGLTRAGARRLLLTLVEAGYARSDGKHFELTARVLALGETYASGLGELDGVRDVLCGLTADLGGSASAGLLDGADLVRIARSHGRRRASGEVLAVGARIPAPATAMGLALLADLAPGEADRRLRHLRRDAPPPIGAGREALALGLAEIRERGFALVGEGGEAGVRTLAVVVPGPSAIGRLAIDLVLPTDRLDLDTTMRDRLPRLRRAAADIAALDTED